MKNIFKNDIKFNLKKLLLPLITIVLVCLILLNIDIHEMLRIMKEFDIKYTIILIISIIISLSFRGLCFKQILSNSVNVSLKDCSLLCITGAALNILLPARAGDFFRAYYIGDEYNISKAKILGAIILERIFDGFSIMSLLLISILFFSKNELTQKLCIYSMILFSFCFLFAFFTYKFNKIESFFNFINQKIFKSTSSSDSFIVKSLNCISSVCNSFFNGFEIICYPKKLIAILFSALGIWFFECLNYYIVIQGFNCDVHWSVVLYITSFIALFSMIPSTSIFIGPYQIAVISAFAIYNISKETALAISIVEQLIVTVTTSVIALIFLAIKNISFKNIKEEINK